MPGRLVNRTQEWWDQLGLRDRVRMTVTILMTVIMISLLFAVVDLRGKTYDLSNQLDTLHATQLSAIHARNVYQTDERGIECEIVHKLNIYTPSCNIPGDAPNGGPSPNGDVAPTTTTTTSTSTTGGNP